MKQKIVSIMVVLCLVLAFAAGCTNGSASTITKTNTATKTETSIKTETQTETKTVTPEQTSYIFTDSVGRDVELPNEIKSFIPSGPVAQMMLLALAPERMAALATKISDNQKQYLPTYIPELTYVGQLYGSADVNRETLAAIGPDVIIDLGEPKKTIVEDMDNMTKQTGVPSIHITATINRCGEAYRTLGKILNCEERANEIAAYCDNVVANMYTTIRTAGNNKVNAIYISGSDNNSANVIAKSSFHAEVFDLMFNNIAVVDAPSGKGTGNTVNLEQLLTWDPDVLLIGDMATYNKIANGEADKPWYELKAVKTGNYYGMPDTPYYWFGSPPSVNRLIGIVWMTEMFYDGVGGIDYDMKAETVKYYKLFYSHDLTDDEYNTLLSSSILKK